MPFDEGVDGRDHRVHADLLSLRPGGCVQVPWRCGDALREDDAQAVRVVRPECVVPLPGEQAPDPLPEVGFVRQQVRGAGALPRHALVLDGEDRDGDEMLLDGVRAGGDGAVGRAHGAAMRTTAGMAMRRIDAWSGPLTERRTAMSVDAHPDLYAWIDTETSGLGDPADGDLFELAIVVTDTTLQAVGRFSTLIRPQHADWDERLEDGARALHDANGLLDELHAGVGLALEDADAAASAWLRSLAGDAPLILGGSSVAYDRAWLAAKTPQLFGRLHHRSVDVTSLWLFLTRSAGVADLRVSGGAHRALADIEDSLQTARAYRALLLGHRDGAGQLGA